MNHPPLLGSHQLERATLAALGADLTDCRALLFADVPSPLAQNCPYHTSPDAQLRSDLHILNRAGRGEGTPPLVSWLRAARRIAASRSAMGVPELDDLIALIERDGALEDALRRLAEARAHGDSTQIRDLVAEVVERKRVTRSGRELVRGDALSGRYELREVLGEGGVGVVWSAYDSEVNDLVAIKVLHPRVARDDAQLERLLRGARAMIRLVDVPHVARIRTYDGFDRERHLRYIVLEQISGGDLREQILAQRVDRASALRALALVARAVAMGHARGIVHRDIKPENILIDRHGAPHLTDFDVAWVRDTTGGTVGVLGTVTYLAPEAMHTLAEVGPAVDVYALGMTALFIVNGAPLPPLIGERERMRFVERLTIGGSLRRVIARAVQQRPSERFTGAERFAQALDEALSAGPVDALAHRPHLIEIPAGSFTMGDGRQDARPRHTVELTTSYFMSTTPVTRAQYRAVMGTDPSDNRRSSDAPVDSVTWHDALEYCDRLSEIEGLTPVYADLRTGRDGQVRWTANGYRLPTEAEWERAARSDTDWGGATNAGALGDYAWYRDGACTHSQPVGLKAHNPFGLYDILGNVSEWCWDIFGPYQTGPVVDPRGPAGPVGAIEPPRTTRGGNWTDRAGFVDVTRRHRMAPDKRSEAVGIRIVRRCPQDIEAIAIPPDLTPYLVWNRTPDGGFVTSLISAPDGYVVPLVHHRPGLTLAAAGRIWRWQVVECYGWLDAPEHLGEHMQGPPRLLLRPDASHRLIDLTTGDIVGESTPASIAPKPADWGLFLELRSAAEVLACHEGRLYIRRTGHYYAGGAHGDWGCSFEVVDLATATRIDEPIGGLDWTSLIAPHRDAITRRLARDGNIGQLDEFTCTLAYPCFAGDGRVGLRLQLTVDASFGSSDGNWDGYTKSTLQEVYPPGAPEMPDAVRIWLGQDEPSFIGWGIADADPHLLREVLEATYYG